MKSQIVPFEKQQTFSSIPKLAANNDETHDFESQSRVMNTNSEDLKIKESRIQKLIKKKNLKFEISEFDNEELNNIVQDIEHTYKGDL